MVTQAELRARERPSSIQELARRSLRRVQGTGEGTTPAPTSTSQDQEIVNKIEELKQRKNAQNAVDAAEIARLERFIQGGPGGANTGGEIESAQAQIRSIVSRRRSRNEEIDSRIGGLDDARRFAGQGFTTASLIDFGLDKGDLLTARSEARAAEVTKLAKNIQQDTSLSQQESRDLARRALQPNTGVTVREGLRKEIEAGNLRLSDPTLKGLGIRVVEEPKKRKDFAAASIFVGKGPPQKLPPVKEKQLTAEQRARVIDNTPGLLTSREGPQVTKVIPDDFSFFIRDEEGRNLGPNIGGLIGVGFRSLVRVGDEIQEVGRKITGPGKFKQVFIPDRRFSERGTSGFDPSTNTFFVPRESKEEVFIRQVPFSSQLGRIESPITPREAGLFVFFDPIFGPGAGSRRATKQKSVQEAFEEFGKSQAKADVRSIEAFKRQLQTSRAIKFESEAQKIRFNKQLREKTREAVKNVKNPEQLESLKKFYREAGREDILDDILAQEGFDVVRVTPQGKVKSKAELETPGKATPAVAEPAPAKLPGPFGAGAGKDTITEGPGAEGKFKTEPSIFSGSGTDITAPTTTILTPTPTTTTTTQQQVLQTQAPILRPPRQLVSPIQTPLTLLGLGQTQIQQTGQLQRPRQSQTPIQGIATGLTTGQATQQDQDTQQRQITITTTKTDFGTPTGPGTPRVPRTKIPKIPVPPPGFDRLREEFRKRYPRSSAFDVFVKRKGKFRKIADDLPLGRALRRGALEARSTLAATFKVKGDPKAVPKFKTDIRFTPDPKTFRTHKIRKGKKIPLEFGTFIEKRNKRLSSREEISEIMGIKRKKRRKKTLF
jgi:hypothetical protein